MKETEQNTLNKTNQNLSDINKAFDQAEEPTQLSSDQDFVSLQKAYEDADFTECEKILDDLEARYPDHPILHKYQTEIKIRLRVKSIEKYTQKTEKRNRRIKGLRLSLFALVSTLLVFVTFVFSYFYLYIQVSADQLQEESQKLTELSEQAQQLLLVGEPKAAAEVLNQIRAIDPSFEKLTEFEVQTYELLLLESKYQTALTLKQEGQELEALRLFKEIEKAWPGLWDVQQQIDSLEDHNNITSYHEGLASVIYQIGAVYSNNLKPC